MISLSQYIVVKRLICYMKNAVVVPEKDSRIPIFIFGPKLKPTSCQVHTAEAYKAEGQIEC